MSELSDIRKQERRVTAAKEQANEESNALNIFARSHPEVQWCQAADRIVRDFFGGDPIDVESLEYSYLHGLKERLPLQSEETERDRLIKYILEHTRMSAELRAHEEARLSSKHTATESLRVKAEEIQRRTEISKLPKEQIRELARGTQRSQYLPLPALYRTREMLLSASADELRSLLKRCGSKQINQILNRKDK